MPSAPRCSAYTTPANTGGFIDPVAQFDHEEVLRGGPYGLAAISGVFAYTGSALPELRGMVVLSEFISSRVFYYDPAASVGTGPAPLYELGFSLNGAPATLAGMDGNPYLGDRVDLRLGTDAGGELYLLSKSFGDIYRLDQLAAVPEPASWTLLIAGIALVGGVLRRRGKSRRRGAQPRGAVENSNDNGNGNIATLTAFNTSRPVPARTTP